MATSGIDNGLSFGQLWAMLASRKGTIFLCLALSVAAAFLGTMLLPKTYTTSADLFIDFRSNDPIAGRSFHPQMDEAYMQTQLDMIKSDEVANRVVDALRLLNNADGKALAEKQGDAQARRTLAKGITKAVEVVPHRSSRVVELQYSSRQPELARDTLNAVIRGYMDLTLNISNAPAKSRQEQYNAQLDAMRKEIDRIQQALTQYQQEVGIVDADERLDTGSRQLNELSSKLISLQSQRQESDAKRQSIEKLLKEGMSAADIPEVAQLRGIPELKLRLAYLDRQAADFSNVYGRNHPKFRSVMAERQTIEDRIKIDAQNALNSILVDTRRASDQERALNRDVEQQQKKLLEMKRHRDVIGSYQRQLESVQKVYNQAIQKYDELLMASSVNTPSIAVLRWAEMPTTHSKPNMLSNLMISVPFGLALGLGLAFTLELSRRRLRCEEDLEREFDLPALGRIGAQ